MKKILSLLSVITITGTSIPTVIANSPNYNSEQNTSLEVIPLQEEFIEKIIDFYNDLPIDKKRDILKKSNNYYKNLSENEKESLKLKQKIKLTNDENKNLILSEKEIIEPIFIDVLPMQSPMSITEEEILEQVPEHLVKISKVTKKILRDALSSAAMDTLTKTLKISLVFSLTVYVLYMFKLFVESVNPDDISTDYAPTHDSGDDLRQYFITYKDNCMDKFAVDEKISILIAKSEFLKIKEIYQSSINSNNDMKSIAIRTYFIRSLLYPIRIDAEIFAVAIVENFEKVNNNFTLLTDNNDDKLYIKTSRNLNCFKIEQEY